MKRNHLKAKVHFVAGKGGVGKTTISQALAHYFALSGYKTLSVTLSEEEAEPPFKSVAEIKQSDENLYELKIRPDQALYEYLLLKIAKPSVITAMLNNNLFRRFCSAVPGLSDLVRLGKIWFHADEIHAPAKEMFDKIVVDMPSSGFVTRFLSVAFVVESAVKVGPLAKEAGLIDGYFANNDNACIHLVAMPKELVVSETEDLYKSIKKNARVALGVLFINRILDFDKDKLAHLSHHMSAKLSNLKYLSEFYCVNKEYEDDQMDKLTANFGRTPMQKIPEYFGLKTQAALIKKIVDRIKL